MSEILDCPNCGYKMPAHERACWIGNIVSEYAALRAENEALRKDAERYRWLRDPPHDRPYVGTHNPWCLALVKGLPTIITGVEIDSPIDTALDAQRRRSHE